jgi:hypothetical protein
MKQSDETPFFEKEDGVFVFFETLNPANKYNLSKFDKF